MITLLIIIIRVIDKKNNNNDDDDDLGGRGREVQSIGKLLQFKEELKDQERDLERVGIKLKGLQ